MLTGDPKGCVGLPRLHNPYKWAPRLIFCHSPSFFRFCSLSKILSEVSLSLVSVVLTSAFCFRLLFCTWGKCPYFSLILANMLVVMHLGKHTSAYFVFGIYIYFLFLSFMLWWWLKIFLFTCISRCINITFLYAFTCTYMHIYIYANCVHV